MDPFAQHSPRAERDVLAALRRAWPRRGARAGRWVAAVAVAGAVAACGSGGSSGSSPAATPTAQATTTVPVTAPRRPTARPAPKRATAASVAKCRALVATRPGLSAAARHDFSGLCQQVATEDPVQIRAAAAEVCRRLVNSSKLPGGDAKNQALAACAAA